jgi:uncharacterized protein YegP (UPF0339 family)
MFNFSFKRRKSGKFEIYQSTSNSEYRWRLKSANGEIIAVSEGYKTKAGAENGVEAVKEISANSKIVFLD